MHRLVSMTLLHMHKGFSCPKWRSRQSWCHFMMSLLYCWCKLRNDIRGVLHEPQGWFSWVPVQFRSVSVWEGNRLFVLANSVPLEKQEYKQTGKYSLFVHPSHMCPRLAWMPLFSFAELLVCQPGVSSPYDKQIWNWKGKDCYCLEQNPTVRINCDIGEPTKFIWHLSWSHFWHPWVGLKCAVVEVWFGSSALWHFVTVP